MHRPFGDVVDALKFLGKAIKEDVAGLSDRGDDIDVAVAAFFPAVIDAVAETNRARAMKLGVFVDQSFLQTSDRGERFERRARRVVVLNRLVAKRMVLVT